MSRPAEATADAWVSRNPDVRGEWRSLAARLPWEQEVGGSNPLSPIDFPRDGRPAA